MRRWLALSLGLVVAVAAGFALLSGEPKPSPDVGASGEIGAESRRQLEAILSADEARAGSPSEGGR